MFSLARRFGIGALICAMAGIAVSGARSAEPTTAPVDSSITVDAYWLRLTSAQIPAGRSKLPADLLNDPKVVYARARAVGFLEQEVNANVTRNVNVVTGATPVVAPGAALYDLTTATEKFGIDLSETPLQLDGNSLEIMFDSTVTIQPEPSPVMPTTRPSTDPANPPNPLVVNDAHEIVGTASVVLHAKSTLRLEIGVPTIVSGMSDHPGAADDRTLCLVLCASKS